ncbi:integrase [Rhizobium aethiopicum]|uniref:Integrase n=1 Tax=Rhizobium aethiopicum TaxID=1138170 RepID=A0A7W6QAN4_9HYPH|nr:integrase arm-type DNA-binding domain-containing protein [Rhizobium aethiopicum]MBB4194060.1 integrase [Rhizobium aethiopicum]MBB4581219.1 integrase [Rhizobium aethiopicum]
MALTDVQVRNLKGQPVAKKYSDAGGLHLLVTPGGSKLWRMQYRFHNKQRTLAFGAYPAVSLADARKRRDEAKKHLAAGLDPSHQAKIEKIVSRTSNGTTFTVIADEFLAKVKREGKATATVAKKEWLVGLARGDLGKRPISEITAAEILVPLRKVEADGNYETARRLRSTIGQVFRYAVATGRAANDPTGALKGALIAPTVTHRAAATERDSFAGLLRAIWAYDGMPETRAALKLMAILYPRPGELRQAEWSEFDLDKREWIIPSERAKMRREHRKPLPDQAVAILKEVHKLTGDGPRVFPAVHTRQRPMSENTLNGALRRLGFSSDEMTSHGFRATASTLLNESGKWPADAIEAELAHAGADLVRRAYHRALYWDERVRMAKWWADEIDALRAEKVDIFS